MNSEELEQTLMGIYGEERGKLTGVVGQRRSTEELWCIQVDAAAEVEAVDEGRRRRRSSGA